MAVIAEEELFERKIELNTEIISFLNSITERLPYFTCMDLQPGVTGLLGLYNIRIEETSDLLIEKIMSYFQLMHSVCGIELFVFVGLRQYFTIDEIKNLYNKLFYEKIYVLDVEPKECIYLDCERVLLIDKDQCVIES